jgi:hypothetical protein
MTLAKVFQQDFEVATSKRLYHIDANGRYGSFGNVARFWLMKVITMIYMMALPIYFHGCLKGMWLFVVGHLVCGELLATMFIVNHVIEGVSYGAKGHSNDQQKEKTAKPATVNGDTPMEKTREQVTADKKSKPAPFVPYNDWAAVQCQTSVNWSPGSWFWNHFSGGLSHQIEHHLFPSICHTVSLYFYCIFLCVNKQRCSHFLYLLALRTITIFKMWLKVLALSMVYRIRVSLTCSWLIERC